MSASIEIRGGKQMAANLKRLSEKGVKLAMAALYQEGQDIMRVSKMRAPIDRGPLRGSGHVQLPRRTARGIEVLLGYGGAASEYAVFIHEGTRGKPNFNPNPKGDFVEAMEAWGVRKKGEAGLGYVLARSIGRKGLEGRKFLEEPFYAALGGMDRRIAARIRRGLS
jgi:hypothetical protein